MIPAEEDNKINTKSNESLPKPLPNSALLVIDMQYDFLPPNGSLAVKFGDKILKPLKQYIDENINNFEIIIFTQDYHPIDHISFACNHPNKKDFDPITYKFPDTETSLASNNNMATSNSIPKEAKISSLNMQSKTPLKDTKSFNSLLWPKHCVQNTKGCEIHSIFTDYFNTLDNKYNRIKVVKKGYLPDREYYSCFNDIWNDHKTEVSEYLQADGDKKIKNVYIVGLALDYCVYNSALSSSQLGYNTFIIKALTKGIDPNWELPKCDGITMI
ncbi:uncharacterized protein SCODWIG_02362 [Saccharomycodes ludwigii]|uniref:nicotinamidase n=1 Tax=Saccharomycodes ludwigii TaxID=36035 RepID=A0A376B7J5_9ASCO|nr:hypothetical protein SCDLUD_001543 [Saccharomycodes ludwigii]KAH3901765.1 hypothetical protein SCDLUD_001543 [Saccharomycodes ludwigii]SSD60601.1 uncharacterized protein SCODWIG_02362 [Saccharomycodes ludwigii]